MRALSRRHSICNIKIPVVQTDHRGFPKLGKPSQTGQNRLLPLVLRVCDSGPGGPFEKTRAHPMHILGESATRLARGHSLSGLAMNDLPSKFGALLFEFESGSYGPRVQYPQPKGKPPQSSMIGISTSRIRLSHLLPDWLIVGIDAPLCHLSAFDSRYPNRGCFPLVFRSHHSTFRDICATRQPREY
jgi:hypothetical protein